MADQDWLAAQFEEHRAHLRRVAYRMLGSLADADDAVQDAWLRASRAGAADVDNVGGWLTTIVARVCLNVLRSRRTHEEDSLEVHVPDPVISPESETDHAAILGDAVGLALLVVLETLGPAERVAFVMHDMFAVPFEEIARLLEVTPAAARQMASRARKRVQGAAKPEGSLQAQRRVVDAFFAAARQGDFDALVKILDPDVVVRSDGGTRRPKLTHLAKGAAAVAGQALTFANPNARLHPVIINGAAGVVVTIHGKPFSVLAFTIRDGRVAEIDAIADPDRVAEAVRSVPLSA